MTGLPVLKVKIYDMTGLTVFSTEERQTGESKKDKGGFLAARAGGVASELTYRGKFSAFERVVADRNLLASYIPIRDGVGTIHGVFELYSDVTPLLQRIEHAQGKLLAIVGVVLALLYGVLFLVVRRADRILHSQYQSILGKEAVEANNRQLKREIAERKRVEAELLAATKRAEVANRAKSEFLANMSHELRTPLNAIIGFSEVMAGEMLGPLGGPKYLQYANDIDKSGKHLLAIINDILDLTKVEADKYELSEEDMDLSVVTESCLDLVRDWARTEKVQLRVDLPRDLPQLYADERMVKQILINLLSNAIKFTSENGEVSVGARHDNGALVIRVSDTGIGMSDNDIATALTPFGQVDSRLSRRHEGTGLGLSLIRSFVGLHGGTLDIDSTPGVGTTIEIRFGRERVRTRDVAQAG